MLKKILLITLLVTTLFGMSAVFQPVARAQDSDIKSGYFMFNLDPITPPGMETSERKGWIERGFNYLFERGITIMAATAASAAVLMMSVGGFMILASAGDENMRTKGKSYIIRSVMGLAFVLGAYILVTTVQLVIKSIYA